MLFYTMYIYLCFLRLGFVGWRTLTPSYNIANWIFIGINIGIFLLVHHCVRRNPLFFSQEEMRRS